MLLLFVQVGAEINATTKHELIHSVRFPLTEDARLGIERFTQYAATRVNYVQLVQYTFSLHSIYQFNCTKCESGLVSSPFSAGARSRQGAHPTGEVGEHRSGGAARAGAHRQRALPPVPLRPLARGPAAPLDLCALLSSRRISFRPNLSPIIVILYILCCSVVRAHSFHILDAVGRELHQREDALFEL